MKCGRERVISEKKPFPCPLPGKGMEEKTGVVSEKIDDEFRPYHDWKIHHRVQNLKATGYGNADLPSPAPIRSSCY